MGLLKTLLKTAAAPIYIPYKVAKKCSKPSQYEHWHHDSGMPTCDDRPQRSSSQIQDKIILKE